MNCLLRLYVSGTSPLGIKAIKNLKKLFEEYQIACSYEIIDILENPQIAEQENVLATPLLVKVNSKDSKRVVGDLSNIQKVCSDLNISITKKN